MFLIEYLIIVTKYERMSEIMNVEIEGKLPLRQCIPVLLKLKRCFSKLTRSVFVRVSTDSNSPHCANSVLFLDLVDQLDVGRGLKYCIYSRMDGRTNTVSWIQVGLRK